MQFLAAGLWSLNERAAGRPGLDLPPLGLEWINDVLEVALRESETLERIREEQERALQRREEWS